MVHLSIIVPVYNEVDSVAILYDKITASATPLNLTWEVIYVDDGSTDGSTDRLLALQHKNDNVVVAVQRRNFGKSKALAVGFSLARGEVVATMDADLQDDPQELPRMLEKLKEGYDVVSGWKQRRNDPLTKTLPSFIANTLTTFFSGVKVRDMNSGLKLYRADCVRSLNLYGDLHRFIPILAHDAGFRITEIPVQHHKRLYGRSKYGPRRLVSSGLDLMTVLFLSRYSRKPLHLFGGFGTAMMLLGFIINLILTVQWIQHFGSPLSERPLLLLGILLMVVGAQFLTIGLLAELLVSYIERNQDPLQYVKALHGHDPASKQEGGISTRAQTIERENLDS